MTDTLEFQYHNTLGFIFDVKEEKTTLLNYILYDESKNTYFKFEESSDIQNVDLSNEVIAFMKDKNNIELLQCMGIDSIPGSFALGGLLKGLGAKNIEDKRFHKKYKIQSQQDIDVFFNRLISIIHPFLLDAVSDAAKYHLNDKGLTQKLQELNTKSYEEWNESKEDCDESAIINNPNYHRLSHAAIIEDILKFNHSEECVLTKKNIQDLHSQLLALDLKNYTLKVIFKDGVIKQWYYKKDDTMIAITNAAIIQHFFTGTYVSLLLLEDIQNEIKKDIEETTTQLESIEIHE